MDARTLAIGRLQKVCSELAELHAELKESDIEASALTVIRDTVDQMRMTAMTLQRGLEWLRLSGDGQGLLMLSIDERMRRASQLNTDIGKDFEAGRIRTDHAALSAYLLVLNEVMEQRLCTRICKSAQLARISETSCFRVYRICWRPWAAGMATESEAMVPDLRTSWAVPLSLEVTGKALGGMRKPLMQEREYGSSTVRA